MIPFGDENTLLKADNPADYEDESKYDRRVMPTVIAGKVQGRTPQQLFCSTHPVILPVGMCGGPVVIDREFKVLPPQERLAPEFDEQGRRKRGVPVKLSNPTKARIEGLKAKHGQEGASESVEEEGLLKFGKSSKLVCGLLEGIVPLDHPVEEIRGSAVFVEGTDIIRYRALVLVCILFYFYIFVAFAVFNKIVFPNMFLSWRYCVDYLSFSSLFFRSKSKTNSFLKEVEDGNIKPVEGGEAFQFVGNDLDPAKMSLKNI